MSNRPCWSRGSSCTQPAVLRSDLLFTVSVLMSSAVGAGDDFTRSCSRPSQELTLDSGPDCATMPHGLHLAYLTRLERLTLLKQAVYGLQVCP